MLSKLRLHKINKNVNNSDVFHISNGFSMFYFDTIRLNVLQVTKNATHLSQHDSPKGVYVHEIALCVTSGAPHSQTHFRLLIVSSKYTRIPMLLETHVLQTTLCATFGARLRSILLGILDHLLGQLGPQDRPRTSGRVTSVGGSAMHMKWPDPIGREAGIGRTQNGNELSVFRACP